MSTDICPFCHVGGGVHLPGCQLVQFDEKFDRVLTRLGDLVTEVHELWHLLRQLHAPGGEPHGADETLERRCD